MTDLNKEPDGTEQSKVHDEQDAVLSYMDHFYGVDTVLELIPPPNDRTNLKRYPEDMRDRLADIRAYDDALKTREFTEIARRIIQIQQGLMNPREVHSKMVRNYPRVLLPFCKEGVELHNKHGTMLCPMSMKEGRETRPWGNGNKTVAHVMMPKKPSGMNGHLGRMIEETKHSARQTVAWSNRTGFLAGLTFDWIDGPSDSILEYFGIEMSIRQFATVKDEEIYTRVYNSGKFRG